MRQKVADDFSAMKITRGEIKKRRIVKGSWRGSREGGEKGETLKRKKTTGCWDGMGRKASTTTKRKRKERRLGGRKRELRGRHENAGSVVGEGGARGGPWLERCSVSHPCSAVG